MHWTHRKPGIEGQYRYVLGQEMMCFPSPLKIQKKIQFDRRKRGKGYVSEFGFHRIQSRYVWSRHSNGTMPADAWNDMDLFQLLVEMITAKWTLYHHKRIMRPCCLVYHIVAPG